VPFILELANNQRSPGIARVIARIAAATAES